MSPFVRLFQFDRGRVEMTQVAPGADQGFGDGCRGGGAGALVPQFQHLQVAIWDFRTGRVASEFVTLASKL